MAKIDMSERLRRDGWVENPPGVWRLGEKAMRERMAEYRLECGGIPDYTAEQLSRMGCWVRGDRV